MIEIEVIGAAAFVVARQDGGAYVYEQFNTAAERMTGLARIGVIGLSPTTIFPPDVAAVLVSNYDDCVAGRTTVEYERTVRVPLGAIVTRTTLTPLFDTADGTITRLLGVSVDVSDQHRLRTELKQTNARLAVALDALGGAHWFFDANRRAFELSKGFEGILGAAVPRRMDLEEWLGHVHPEDREDTCFVDLLAGRIEQGTAEFRVIAGNGDVRWLRCRRRAVAEDGRVAGIAGIVVDVTQEKRREAALTLQAASDPLTGLANRRRFDEVLVRERDRAQKAGAPLSLLMIDVDHFKRYNDIYGHIAGDALLKRIAQCLSKVVQAVDGMVARYGGEEFVAVLAEMDTVAAAALAEGLLSDIALLDVPHSGSPSGRLSVSVGVAGHRGSARPHTDLVALADAALYRAKNDGRNCCRVIVAPHLRSLPDSATPSAA